MSLQALETELLSVPRDARVMHSGRPAKVAKQKAEAKLVCVHKFKSALPVFL